MSGLRPESMRQFYARLHARGENTTTLGAAVGRNRSTVTRLLTGSRRRGPAWKALARYSPPRRSPCSTWHNATRGTKSASRAVRSGHQPRSHPSPQIGAPSA